MILRLLVAAFLLVTGAIAGLLGAAALLRGWFASRGDETSDELDLVAIFDGVERANRSTAFRRGRILTWFGAASLDLREATIAPEATLEIRTLLGGVAVHLPPGCRVVPTTSVVLGGVDVRAPEPDDPAAPTVRVEVATVFGGVSVDS
jgi:hypothetical protein